LVCTPVATLERALFAPCISMCQWLQLIHEERLAPLANAPFSRLWA
jgi:hypothetical protein